MRHEPRGGLAKLSLAFNFIEALNRLGFDGSANLFKSTKIMIIEKGHTHS